MFTFYILVLSLYLPISTLGQSPDAEFEIDEELPLATMIGSIANKSWNYTNTKVVFAILDSTRLPGNLFNISRSEGVLYVAKRIDRESLCLVLETCTQTINILVNSDIESRVITVNIKIRDINDNPPYFDKDTKVLQVTEGNTMELKISGANDRDYNPIYKVRNYTLDSQQEVFQINATKSLDGSSEIEIRLNKPLDREQVQKYQFTITAYDGGSPPLSAVLSVTVEVTDVNDNAPVFVNSSYNVFLDGKLSTGSVVLQVSATDADEGYNALVSYDFSSVQKPFVENLFRINSSTGNISVVAPLRSGTTEFIVEAQDHGNPSLKAQTVVRVTVVNTGNTPPRVSITTISGFSDQNVVSVLEPAARGYFIAFVIVDDDKIDDVSCDISNEVFKMEPVQNKGYTIVLQSLVDRETRDSYNLTVSCIDRGEPPYTTSASFTVKIDDANDNAPEFTQKKFTRSVKEGKKNGEFVLQISASDKDIGQNAVIVYSIDPEYAKFFFIDSKTGALTAVGDLDRETYPVMTFNVFAEDKGFPPLSSSAEVVIILEDVNDNAPEFTQPLFRIQTLEEVGGTRIIGNITAIDPDDGVNSQLEYFFTGSLDGADGAFTVLQNGSIQCSSKLDREERVNYSFSIMVRDKGVPSLSVTASVIIEVLDINDNTPTILFPKSQNHTILISTFPDSGIILSRIIAYDDDSGDNGSLRFAIISGNEDNCFEISESSGEFKISQASHLRNMKTYEVSITVSDRGMPSKFSTTLLKIDVQYENMTKDMAQAGPQKQEDYIIIVAVVAAVTVIFSTLIIVAICVVFQKDRGGRSKPNSKLVIPNMQTMTSVTVEEKVQTVEPVVFPSQNIYPLNNLSSPPSAEKYPVEERTWSVEQCHPPSKGKAVSFNLETEKVSTPSSPPLFSTFGPPHGRPCDGDLYHQKRSSMTRQVSGVKYSPVSTCVHTDDVTSDTSADTTTSDTTTSDSGRGNSIDDVNFDQIMKGDLSPRFNLHGQSQDYPSQGRKFVTSERPPNQHVRFSPSSDVFPPPELPPKQKINYEGALPFIRSPRGDSRCLNYMGAPKSSNNNIAYNQKTAPFVTPRQLSVTSIDDDATTTTSGSYIINPDDLKIETFVGSDIIV
ncbi:protocadherin alpha-7-like isoform X1 [Biomphalaria glabrata]|uniref:Protocadherin alpha-7-like isoform X1 n=1 Tax=Biomphalaria glabrata TaxID=6526 RepID=A0A9W3B5U2_BIOGL|nr:protocadherin alpha-7-like isoform X1 [Biomphalaria glabrata]XP_055894796.1 protocadherin alpha-7-like isoform X1 [Biomphalaria glabrata]